MKRIGLIGPGQHGSRYLEKQNGGDLVRAVLCRTERTLHTGHRVFTDRDAFYAACDAVVIATPPDSHVELAVEALKRGKPVLIEKPLALDWESCETIISTAEDLNLPLMVGHTHLWHEWFEDKCLDTDRVPQTVVSYAGGPGPVREYSALLDWGPHEIAMACMAFCEFPEASRIQDHGDGTYEIFLQFDQGSSTSIVSNRMPSRHRSFNLHYQDGPGWTYTGAEPSNGTPIMRLMSCFQAVMYGQEDVRALPSFNRAVYQSLFGCLPPADQVTDPGSTDQATDHNP